MILSHKRALLTALKDRSIIKSSLFEATYLMGYIPSHWNQVGSLRDISLDEITMQFHNPMPPKLSEKQHPILTGLYDCIRMECHWQPPKWGNEVLGWDKKIIESIFCPLFLGRSSRKSAYKNTSRPCHGWLGVPSALVSSFMSIPWDFM